MRTSSSTDFGSIKVDLSSFWNILEFPNCRSQHPPASIIGHSLALPGQHGQPSHGKIHTLALPPAITPNSNTETEDHGRLIHTDTPANELRLPSISPDSSTANRPGNNGLRTVTRDSPFFDGINISVEDLFSQDFINTDILDANGFYTL